MSDRNSVPDWVQLEKPKNDAASVAFYRGKGCRLSQGGRVKPFRLPVGGGRRGKVVSWTPASRRRLREVLLTHDAPGGWITAGLTFTIPGDVVETGVASSLWRTFSRWASKSGVGLIWRAEVQRRGQLHWHAIGISRPEWLPYVTRLTLPGPDGKRPKRELGALPADEAWREMWWAAVKSLGDERMSRPGSIEHAADVRCDEGDQRGKWLRYLQDHASKRKQGQVAENIGRHWGVVGRALWRVSLADTVEHLSPAEFKRLVRAVQRMTRPRIRAPQAPFGSKLGWKSSRGRIGSSVWFVSTAAMSALVEWARMST